MASIFDENKADRALKVLIHLFGGTGIRHPLLSSGPRRAKVLTPLYYITSYLPTVFRLSAPVLPRTSTRFLPSAPRYLKLTSISSLGALLDVSGTPAGRMLIMRNARIADG